MRDSNEGNSQEMIAAGERPGCCAATRLESKRRTCDPSPQKMNALLLLVLFVGGMHSEQLLHLLLQIFPPSLSQPSLSFLSSLWFIHDVAADQGPSLSQKQEQEVHTAGCRQPERRK